MKQQIQLRTSNGAAWRAFYVYLRERKVFHLGIDPTAQRPYVFGSIAGHEWRIHLPLITYKHEASSLRMALSRAQQHIVLSLDGR